MTLKRHDNHSTEFGLWLREQNGIDSSLGFVASNIDFFWRNYKTGLWMLLEEKRFMANLKTFQAKMFAGLEGCIKSPNFKGFHLIVFEKTSPEDGSIFVDDEEISKTELIKFLRFEMPDNFYTSYFEKARASTAMLGNPET